MLYTRVGLPMSSMSCVKLIEKTYLHCLTAIILVKKKKNPLKPLILSLPCSRCIDHVVSHDPRGVSGGPKL